MNYQEILQQLFNITTRHKTERVLKLSSYSLLETMKLCLKSESQEDINEVLAKIDIHFIDHKLFYQILKLVTGKSKEDAELFLLNKSVKEFLTQQIFEKKIESYQFLEWLIFEHNGKLQFKSYLD